MKIADRFVLYSIFSVMMLPFNGGCAGIVMLWGHFIYKYIEIQDNIEKYRRWKRIHGIKD